MTPSFIQCFGFKNYALRRSPLVEGSAICLANSSCEFVSYEKLIRSQGLQRHSRLDKETVSQSLICDVVGKRLTNVPIYFHMLPENRVVSRFDVPEGQKEDMASQVVLSTLSIKAPRPNYHNVQSTF